MDTAKETAKETLQKVTHPSMDMGAVKGGSLSKEEPTLERDINPKPTKVHLQDPGTESQLAVYVPSGKLKGKRALITGGDSGIGRAVAILFAMEGARMAVVYRDAEEQDAQHTKVQVEKNGGEILLIPSDLSQAINCNDVAERAAAALGGIDILVNNAATRHEHGDICDISE